MVDLEVCSSLEAVALELDMGELLELAHRPLEPLEDLSFDLEAVVVALEIEGVLAMVDDENLVALVHLSWELLLSYCVKMLMLQLQEAAAEIEYL